MYQATYEKLKDSEAKAVMTKLEKMLEGNPFRKPVIHRTNMPFYPGAFFHDVSEPEQYPTPHRFAVEKDNVLTLLDGTNVPIYNLNKSIPLELSDATIADYIRFFFTFVTGQHGRFEIIEQVDDLRWREEPPPNARRALGQMIRELKPQKQADGSYTAECTMLFHESLYKSAVTVTPAGEVSLRNDEILVEDIPVIDSLFGQ